MSYKVYKVLKDRVLHGNLMASAGDIVRDQRGHDYGLASDDTRHFGHPHVSVTHKEDGGWPGFTIPISDLEELAPAA